MKVPAVPLYEGDTVMPAGLIRNCGTARSAGAAYIVTTVSDVQTAWSIPIDKCLICPPVPVPDYEARGISPSGMTLMPDLNGKVDPATGQPVMHLVDWIGGGSSPVSKAAYNWADHWEESRRYGFSSKVPVSRKLLAPLSPGLSGVYLIHPRGSLKNPQPLWADRQHVWCPAEHPAHLDGNVPDEVCQGLLWEAVAGGVPRAAGGRATERFVPGYVPPEKAVFSYDAWRIPADYAPEWEPAIVAWRPITRIDVIVDPVDSKHVDTVKSIEAAGCRLPVSVQPR